MLVLSCNSEHPKENIDEKLEKTTYLNTDTFKTDYEKEEGYSICKIITDDLIICDFPDKLPEFYVTINGDSLEFNEYFRSDRCDFPEKLKYYLRVLVDSTGQVKVLKVLKEEGIKPKDFNIYEFSNRIKAIPAEEAGKVVPLVIVIPLERQKYIY